MTTRQNTRRILVGGVPLGGGAPIAIQSMTNTRTADAEGTLAQVKALAAAGCGIVRVTVNDDAAADALPAILAGSPVPIVADIHFRGDLAIRALESGVHKLRVNPGNLPLRDIDRVADCLRAHRVPLRIGVNGGSMPKDILDKHGGLTASALAEAALWHTGLLEKRGVTDIAIAVKTSDAPRTVQAYRLVAKQCDYPLHLGVTEAGVGESALVKSAVGIGALLLEGLGDTIRVSIAGDPLPEAAAARDILRACGLYHKGADIIACPTCGRCGYDVAAVAQRVKEAVQDIERPLRIAVMGCVVNGPGEAREADVGVAGGESGAVLFCKDRPPRKIPLEGMAEALIDEVRRLVQELPA